MSNDSLGNSATSDRFHRDYLDRLMWACKEMQTEWEQSETLINSLWRTIQHTRPPEVVECTATIIKSRMEPLSQKAISCVTLLEPYLEPHAPKSELYFGLRACAQSAGGNLGELISVMGKLTDLCNQIFGEIKKGEQKIASRVVAINKLEADLGLELSEVPSLKQLHEIEEIECRLKESFDILKDRVDKDTSRVKAETQDIINDIHTNFDVANLDNANLLEIDRLSDALTSNESLSETRHIHRKVVEYRTKLAALSGVRRLESLKFESIQARGSASKTLVIIDWLNEKKRYEESLALIIILQSALSLEEVDMDDFSGFVDQAIEAAVGTCENQSLGIWWPDVLAELPWLNAIGEDEIQNSESRLKLLIVTIIISQERESDTWLKLFYQWDLHSIAGIDDLPLLKSISEDMAAGKKASITNSPEFERYYDVLSEIDEFFRYDIDHRKFFVQVAKGNKFYEMEKDYLIPKLKEIADQIKQLCNDRVFEEALRTIQCQKPEKIFTKSCQEMAIDPWESTYFAQEIVGVHGYIPKFLKICETLIQTAEKLPLVKVISVQGFKEECRILSLREDGASKFYDNIISCRWLNAPSKTCAINELIPTLCTFSPPVMALAFTYITQYSQAPDIIFDQDDNARMRLKRLYIDMIKALPEKFYDRKAVEGLSISKNYFHAARVATIVQECAAEVGELDRQWQESDAKIRKQLLELNHNSDVPDLSRWLRFRCYNAIEKWLEDHHERIQRNEAVTEKEKSVKIRQLIDHDLLDLRSMAEECGFSGKLADKIWNLINTCDRQLRHLTRNQDSAFNANYQRLKVCIEGIRFAIEHRDSQAAEEVSIMMNVQGPSVSEPTHGNSSSIEHELSEADKKAVEIALDAWRSLESNHSVKEENDLVKQLVLAVCLRCRLYAQTQEDFKAATHVEFRELGADGLRFAVSKMKFPRNTYLSDPIYLYVVPGAQPKAAHIDAVQACIASRPHFHIIFVPGNVKVALQIEKKSKISKKGLVIGPKGLNLLLTDSEPRHLLSRRLLQQASQVASSPFLFSGVIHAENQLFAGREDEIQGLLNQPRGSLCGGRRIGKTSLVQAVRMRLVDSDVGWRVAYEDLQHFRPQETTEHAHLAGHWDVALLKAKGIDKNAAGGDPDLKVARDIARSLELATPETLDAFSTDLIKLANKFKVAIIMDEVDCYIKASRWYHGDQNFPLMSALRRVEQSARGGQIKVLVAGFKELHYETSRDDVSDPSYPFRNWMRNVPLGPLKYKNASNELIRDGLVWQLGYELSNEACRKIHDLSSGHPAFLQFFCDQLDQRNRDRLLEGNSMLNVEEVMEVYQASSSLDGNHTYLSFVEQTLGYNLDPLERAIILTMALNFKQEGERGEIVPQFGIIAELQQYFDILMIEAPSKINIHWAFENLTMVGMLKKHEPNNYQLTYSSYFDILSRLNQMEKTNLEEAIKNFNLMRHAIPGHVS